MEVEETVIEKIRQRRDFGRSKYGVTMERADLTDLDWLNHAQQEAMDLAIYLEKLIKSQKEKQVPKKKRTFLEWLREMRAGGFSRWI